MSWCVGVRGATGERGSRIDTWCHGWGKKKAPPKRGFQPRCRLSCELGLLYPQEQNFLVVSPKVRSWLQAEVPKCADLRPLLALKPTSAGRCRGCEWRCPPPPERPEVLAERRRRPRPALPFRQPSVSARGETGHAAQGSNPLEPTLQNRPSAHRNPPVPSKIRDVRHPKSLT